MPRQQEKKKSELGAPDTPQLTKRDPSLLTVPTTSMHPVKPHSSMKEHYECNEDENVSRWQAIKNYLYDRRRGTFCNRTCKSWGQIIVYSIFYLIFLMTYTLMFLYGSLMIIKGGHAQRGEIEALVYTEHKIGLSATPTSVNEFPIIWYREGNKKDYKKYITAIDDFFIKHKNLRDDKQHLGPCGEPPYGYGEKPCVIVRINKLYTAHLEPLKTDSPAFNKAPDLVKEWVKSDNNKLWLYCNGYHPYDMEHVTNFKYHPYPPGFDASLFPLGKHDFAPLIGVQVTNFTKGVSIAIHCKLYFESGKAGIDFLLYVGPKNRIPLKTLSLNSSFIETHK